MTDDIDKFIQACKNGDIEQVKRLMKIVDPSVDDNWAICIASSRCHLNVVRLLLTDSRVDPSEDDNFSIRWASIHGHLEVVRLLLEDPRVDPTARNNCAMRSAHWSIRDKITQLFTEHMYRLDGPEYTRGIL
uniref:Uncharacterized protein n=1 Tax=viral metagenome TaxID=1070528 RepID=A0A6C0JS48_9ZZZZ